MKLLLESEPNHSGARMAEILRFLLVPVMIAAGWWAGGRHQEASRRAARIVAATMLIILAALLITGAAHNKGQVLSSAHRWIGHGLIAYAWLLVPLATGVVMRQRGKILAMLLSCAVTLAMLLLSGFTGYLGPSHGDVRSDETVMRFYVLHCVVLPLCLVLAVGLLIYWLRPRAEEPLAHTS